MADVIDYDDGRLSEQSYDQWLHVHKQVLANWSESGRPHSEVDVLHVVAIRVALVAVYVVIIVVGIVGNGLVVVVAASRSPRSSTTARSSIQSATHVFVVCLAVSDLALCLFSLPVQLHYQLTDNWYLGSALCRVIFAAFAVPMYLSTVTIMLIAVDRYVLIVRPFGRPLSGRQALWLIAINVVASMLLAIPVVHYTTLQEVVADPDIGVRRMVLCVERWNSSRVRRAYSIFTFVIQFCVPLIATATLYCRIYARLRLRRRRAMCNQSRHGSPGGAAAGATNPFRRCPSSASEMVTTERGGGSTSLGVAAGTHVASRTNKTNRILAAIVVNFVVCWLPWNVFGLITELDHRLVRGRHFELADLALKGFAMASACVNPLLYCWLNENLRRNLGTLSLRLNPFHNLSRRSRSGGGAGSGVHEAAHQGDLPRFLIQPPSFHSNAAGGSAGAGGMVGLLPPESTTAARCDSLQCTSFLAITERYSISSVLPSSAVGNNSDNESDKDRNIEF